MHVWFVLVVAFIPVDIIDLTSSKAVPVNWRVSLSACWGEMLANPNQIAITSINWIHLIVIQKVRENAIVDAHDYQIPVT